MKTTGSDGSQRQDTIAKLLLRLSEAHASAIFFAADLDLDAFVAQARQAFGAVVHLDARKPQAAEQLPDAEERAQAKNSCLLVTGETELSTALSNRLIDLVRLSAHGDTRRSIILALRAPSLDTINDTLVDHFVLSYGI